MERQIVLKIKDGKSEKEYPLRIVGNADDKWSRILDFLFNDDAVKIKDVVFKRIFAVSTDEVLVASALGAYTGIVPLAYMERILNRFPSSEDIQLNLALCCSKTKNKEFLEKILEQPATEHVKDEVEFFLETL